MHNLLVTVLTLLLCIRINYSVKLQPQSPMKFVRAVSASFGRNPLARAFYNAYSFFYWLPRRNLPYDAPFVLFKNSSVDFISWYQIPHNLPPYRYLGEGHPDDFFCFGLPGNTLPLGNWDPWGLHQVSRKVVLKYRESELKHGRIAMLASSGIILQEHFHPLHPEIGGLAITHMDQLTSSSSFVSSFLSVDGLSGMDFYLVLAVLCVSETFALFKNWNRWLPNEYNHQFDHNIGIGNLRKNYRNGDYGFDPLGLKPENPEDFRDFVEIELNHGRLAMIAFIGILAQEYMTGLPPLPPLQWP